MASDSKHLRRFSSPRLKMATLFLIPSLLGNVPAANASDASIVVDAESGRVLHEVNANSLNYPASLTKMMTLYMVFSALQNKEITLETRWKVSAFAARQPPTKLGLRAGQTISVGDCILALITKSANDMAVVAAEGLAGSESRFARMMTERSRDLRMTHTIFRNASGLPNPEQITTARDISILALALLRDFPDYYRFFSTQYFEYGSHRYRNHNRLLQLYRGTDGIKTGYIRASGYNLAASTVRNGRRLIGVVLGGRTSNSRNQQMMVLLDRAFAQLERNEPQYAEYPAVRPGLVVPTRAIPSITTTAGPFESYLETRPDPIEERVSLWGIQVGAFHRFRHAESAVSRARAIAPRFLNTSRTIIAPYRHRQGFIYRARLTGITKKDAEKACAVLESKNVSCITVPPSSQPEAVTAR